MSENRSRDAVLRQNMDNVVSGLGDQIVDPFSEHGNTTAFMQYVDKLIAHIESGEEPMGIRHELEQCYDDLRDYEKNYGDKYPENSALLARVKAARERIDEVAPSIKTHYDEMEG